MIPRARIHFVRSLVLLLLGMAPASQAADRPNILFILADDLGYGDAGCYGNAGVRTPNIDRLAREGVRLTDFYANGPECTPTRAAFMTGRYQHRVGGLECALGTGNVGRYDDAIRLRAKNELGLPASETSIARMLKDAGYTTACIGKWHLGYEPKFFPQAHGFDYWFGVLGGGMDYFQHTEPEGLPALYLQGQPTKREGYVTDLITAEAVKFLQRTDAAPFFLYVPYTAPHAPYQGPQDKKKPISEDAWSKGDQETYRSMIERLDDGVGIILAALAARDLVKNTVVVFASDNGGPKIARNAPLSGNKGSTYEGGIRVPCIVRWPGMIKPGTESAQMGLTMDLTASFVRIAGAKPARKFDGVDLIQLLQDGGDPQPRTLFWRGRRGENTWRGVRAGPLKYVTHKTGAKSEEWLFDLSTDVAEKHDLLKARPAEAQRIRQLLSNWEEEVKPVR